MNHVLLFIDDVLKSGKNSLVKTKRGNMRTFHVQLLFQAVSESYVIDCTASNSAPTKLTQFNSSGECTFKKKS